MKFVANHLSDQQNIKHTRISIGMLNSISGSEPPHSQIDLHRPIKWEDFSFNGAAAEKPFSKATSFSNLGYVRLPEGALNLALFQVLGGPQMSALPIVIVGHEGGLRIQFGQREGRKKRRMRRTWRSCSRLSRIGWCRGRIASVSSSCRSESAASSACRGRYSFEDREVDIENKIHTFCL